LTPTTEQRTFRGLSAALLVVSLLLPACAAAPRPPSPVADVGDGPEAPTPGITPLTLEQEEAISQ
jgi:hypothetical protein